MDIFSFDYLSEILIHRFHRKKTKPKKIIHRFHRLTQIKKTKLKNYEKICCIL
jgi:hypothetical protein